MKKIFKVDGYTLTSHEEGRYTISFVDSKGITVESEITESIYEEYKKEYLMLISQRHKKRKYTEHLDLNDNALYRRTKEKQPSVEKMVEEKEFAEVIERIINTLTEKQKRRFEMYYEEGLTYKEIAEREDCIIASIQDTMVLIRKKFEGILGDIP